MKVSQNWLKSLVEINTTPVDLSEKLSIKLNMINIISINKSNFKYLSVLSRCILKVLNWKINLN